MSYCEAIRQIILDLIVADEIDYKYDEIKQISETDEINMSSMDTVKVIIELETHFNISIEDSLLVKLNSLKDFERVVEVSMKNGEAQEQRVSEIKNEVFSNQ